MKMKRILILGLTLCFLCFASACTTGNTDGGTNSGDLAGTNSPLPSQTPLTGTDDGAIGDLGEDVKSGAEDLFNDASDALDDIENHGGTAEKTTDTNPR